MTTDAQIESEIQAKGLTAPRVTPADIEAAIVSEQYFTAAEGVYGTIVQSLRQSSPEHALHHDFYANHKFDVATANYIMKPHELLTFCVLVLANGFTVTGESACASPENFDAEVGRKIARQNAVQKIWPLLGYALRDKLAAAQ